MPTPRRRSSNLSTIGRNRRCEVCGLAPGALAHKGLHFACEAPRTCNACIPPFLTVEQWQRLCQVWDSGLPAEGPPLRVTRNGLVMTVVAVDYPRKPSVLVGHVMGSLVRWGLHSWNMPERFYKETTPQPQPERPHAC
jgi:hypothetical protein